MFARLSARPCTLLAAWAASGFAGSLAAARADDETQPSAPALSYVRRERAARVLTIATAVEPDETAKALRLARSAIRRQPYQSIAPSERSFLQHTLKEGVARGVACAAGGAAASYAILKIVLLVIPLVPSRAVTRAAMSAVSFGAAVVELAAFPDITTIELLLMRNSDLGTRARRRIEEYNPHLLLLETLDRQADPAHPHAAHEAEPADIDSKHAASEFFDQEIHFR